MRLAVLIAVLAIASVVVDTRASQRGAIAREVAAARAAGKTEVVLGLSRVLEDGYPLPARLAFGGLTALVIARPRMDVSQTVTPDAIYSFTEAVLERVIFEPAAGHRRSDLCAGVPAAPAVDAGRVAIPFKRGQTVIDGVTVRMGGPPSWLQLPDDRYLVLGAFCAPGVLAVKDFYPVSEDGTIWPFHLHEPNTVDLTNRGILRQSIVDRVPAFLSAVERDPTVVDRERWRSSTPGPGGSGAITGRVVDTSGVAIPGSSVTVLSRTSVVAAFAITQPDGRYRVDALPPGSYRIVVSLPGFIPVIAEYAGVSGTTTMDATLVISSAHDSIILESPTGQLAGRVTDEHGRPWPVASVTLDLGFLARVTTDDDGRYALTQVRPGRYPVRIAAAGHDLFEGTVTIERDRTTRISTVLTRSSSRNAAATFVSGPRTAAFRVETGDGAWTMTVQSPSTPALDAFIADVAAHQFDGRVAITAPAGVLDIVDRRSRLSGWSMRVADDGAGGVSVEVRRGDAAFTARAGDGIGVVRRVEALISDGRISQRRPLPILAISAAQR